MKISQKIVIAALLGNLNQSEVVSAVERYHHLRPHSYIQFIDEPVLDHPEGVVMFKDYNIQFDGYPNESFAQWDSRAPHQRQGVFSQIGSQDLGDTDIKSKTTETKVEVKPEPSEEEVAKDKEVQDANAAVAKKADEFAKATASPNTAEAKTEGPDAMGDFKKKLKVQELKEERDFVKDKTEDEIAKETAATVEKLAKKADHNDNKKKEKTLETAIEKEEPGPYRDTLKTKLDKVKKQVAVDQEEEAVEAKEEAEVEKQKAEKKKELDEQIASLQKKKIDATIVSEKLAKKIADDNKEIETPMIKEKKAADEKAAAKVVADKKLEEIKEAQEDEEKEKKEEANDARLAKTAAKQAEEAHVLDVEAKKVAEAEVQEKEDKQTAAKKVAAAGEAKANKAKKMTDEEFSANLPEKYQIHSDRSSSAWLEHNYAAIDSESESSSDSD